MLLLKVASILKKNLSRMITDGFNYISAAVGQLSPDTLQHTHLLCMTLLTLGVLAIALSLLAKPSPEHERHVAGKRFQDRNHKLFRQDENTHANITYRESSDEKESDCNLQRYGLGVRKSFLGDSKGALTCDPACASFTVSPGTSVSRKFVSKNFKQSTPCTWTINPSSASKKHTIYSHSSNLRVLPKEAEKKTSYNSSLNSHSNLRISSIEDVSKELSKINNSSVYTGDYYAKLTSEQQKVLKAIRDDRLDVLTLHKRNCMDFSFNDNNPLREAVLSNKIGILKFLHEECCIDLNAESGFAIRWAARKDHVEMVEWLCSLECIDVTACGGEALLWARENYHFSVEEILEEKIKQYERANGIAFGSTLKQVHQNGCQMDISRKE